MTVCRVNWTVRWHRHSRINRVIFSRVADCGSLTITDSFIVCSTTDSAVPEVEYLSWPLILSPWGTACGMQYCGWKFEQLAPFITPVGFRFTYLSCPSHYLLAFLIHPPSFAVHCLLPSLFPACLRETAANRRAVLGSAGGHFFGAGMGAVARHRAGAVGSPGAAHSLAVHLRRPPRAAAPPAVSPLLLLPPPPTGGAGRCATAAAGGCRYAAGGCGCAAGGCRYAAGGYRYAAAAAGAAED
eukprot:GHVU01143643.1.p1 GENE.GHVU01143643.1~~GHVU01143643.1.p1  ORF type:complete len:242 (-),score=14.87 GHVU01143643.1:1135-1860(-)